MMEASVTPPPRYGWGTSMCRHLAVKWLFSISSTLHGVVHCDQKETSTFTGITSSSANEERPSCRVGFGQQWKTATGRQYFEDIVGLSSTTVT